MKDKWLLCASRFIKCAVKPYDFNKHSFAYSDGTTVANGSRVNHPAGVIHYFFCALKTAWTPSLLPSCHDSNSASRAMLATFCAKPASCSLFRSKMYLRHTKKYNYSYNKQFFFLFK